MSSIRFILIKAGTQLLDLAAVKGILIRVLVLPKIALLGEKWCYAIDFLIHLLELKKKSEYL